VLSNRYLSTLLLPIRESLASALILADGIRDVARRAAQLRARYRVRPAGALQAATALVHGTTAFVTSDRRLVRLGPVLGVISGARHLSEPF
jgi:predicted nucleic acid-binding protein